MCRNIHTLHNFEPAATDDEVHAAALQFVRKVSGSTKPRRRTPRRSTGRRRDRDITRHLLDDLVTTAPPKDREVEAAKARARAAQRYATVDVGSSDRRPRRRVPVRIAARGE